MINNGRGIYNSLVAAGFKIPEECQRIVIDIQTEEETKIALALFRVRMKEENPSKR